jgi:hypothetical protein
MRIYSKWNALFEITNFKQQITNKFQITNANKVVQSTFMQSKSSRVIFEICDLKFICDLLFVIYLRNGLDGKSRRDNV